MSAFPVTVRGTTLFLDDTAEQRRHKLARIVLDSLTQFAGVLDPDGNVLDINPAAMQEAGILLDEISGKPFWNTCWWQGSESVRDSWRDAIKRAAAGETVRWDTHLCVKAGNPALRDVDVTITPVSDDQGTVQLLVVEARDISGQKMHEREASRRQAAIAQLQDLAAMPDPATGQVSPDREHAAQVLQLVIERQAQMNQSLEAMVAERTASLEAANTRLRDEAHERAQMEFALRQSQKMEAIGKLTGGVAHDFNNLLQVIGGNLQLLVKEISASGNERAQTRLRNALNGVSRGSKLASQLLSFGRRQPLAPTVVNLGRFVRGMDDMLRRALGEGIEVETVATAGLWNTLADTSQIENAVLNLAINARDAMEGHGKLTIEAGNAALTDVYAARHADLEPGEYVMLAISDTGPGMPPEVLEHVFEPFFTTKPEGQGTGLGLSMVYGFVKQSNGHIKIYSEPGEGTTVRIYLPRAEQAEDDTPEPELGPVVGGTETILVVEDDEQVRETVVAMLSDLGYAILKAKDAVSALAIVESGAPVDLLFTDVVMPGPLRSPDLARQTRQHLPDVAVLFTSGYTENAIVHAGRLDAGVELLSKPYTREALARKVRHVLRNQQQRNLARGQGAAARG
ncbi:two-component hyrid sensor and regulator [Bordetella ansorpii]|uniref:histidine kinase n=1 Tax=Bordetella ansorpii TaxID=288768 RepID=A0A157SMM1_9BORD|nr:two-component hyrid sensor and regulator [Bordetella ansorpii]